MSALPACSATGSTPSIMRARPRPFHSSRHAAGRKCCGFVRGFSHPELTRAPGNLTDAETRGPGLTPLFPSNEDLALEIEAPNGEILSASDPALPGLIGGDQLDASDLTIIRSDRAMAPRRDPDIADLSQVVLLQLLYRHILARNPRA